MLLGLTFVAVFFQPFLEIVFIYLLVHGRDKRFRSLVKKALQSHRSRNQKSALMLSISLSFILFMGSEFALQSHQIIDDTYKGVGSDLVFTSPSIEHPLSIKEITEAMEDVMSDPNTPVKNWSYKAYNIRHILEIQRVSIASAISIIVLSKSLMDEISCSIDQPLRIEVQVTNQKKFLYTKIFFLAKVRAVLEQGPGLSVGSYRGSASGSHAVVSMKQYQEILSIIMECVRQDEEQINHFTTKDNKNNYDVQNQINTLHISDELPEIPLVDPPIQDLYVKLKKKIPEDDRFAVQDIVYSHILKQATCYDSQGLEEIVSGTMLVLDTFYIIFGTVAIILCFFVLWISFTANVRQNQLEFGILRSIGLTAWETIRIYVYEALSLVLACIVSGSIIGLGISITLTLEITMFTESPLTYYFPFPIYLLSTFLSIIVAILGSILAAIDMKNKDIAEVIRIGA
ncbi:MAG: hypothetical protein EZS28_022118 [Streblomastix strix]|uniref:ABC3 transporter permease C-terminal domain-containing protein n=1 Tax=Streblomastix strix TaxID=222440 RepID=A0A5J4VJB4_9EUKA|nr:MAG: hypothetical protein EZS28_022118 [Streblomastix strix]